MNRSPWILCTLLLLAPGPALEAQTLTPELALATFDSVWSRVATTHYDPDLLGVDWEAARDDLRPRAESAESMGALRGTLRDLLAKLGESHFAILEGVAADALPSDAGGDADPGLTLRLVDEGVVVSRVRPGSPAHDAGVRPGWLLRQVGEVQVDELRREIAESLEGRGELLPLYLPTALHLRLRGVEGSEVEVSFSDAEDAPVEVQLLRAEPDGTRVTFGNLGAVRVEVASEALPLASGGTAGVIRISSWFPVISAEVAEAVDTHRDTEGLVIDLRGNPGGVGGLVMGIAGHLIDERVDLGEMRTRDSTLRFAVNPQRVAPDGRRVEPFDGPVAILVDGQSASTSEIFAGGLQALGRARIFGEATPGQALPALIVPLPNGDRLMHAVADFTAPDGSRLEGRGVLPDEPAPLTRAALLEGRDPALEAALHWIEAHSPRE